MDLSREIVLVNAITGMCAMGAGLVFMLFCILARTQPRRWMFACLSMLGTGIPTVWYYGFGDTFTWRTADAVAFLILSWALQNALIGDFFRKRALLLSSALGIINFVGIVLLMFEAHLAVRSWTLRLGGFGAFSIAEMVPIFDAVVSVLLLLVGARKVPPNARPMMCVAACTFVAHFFLAATVHLPVNTSTLSFHAMWHIIGVMGFLSFWVFNDVRFHRPDSDI